MLTHISVANPISVVFPFTFLAVRIFSIGYYKKLYWYKRVVMLDCFLLTVSPANAPNDRLIYSSQIVTEMVEKKPGPRRKKKTLT